MPLTPIKISVFYYKHDGHIPQNFYYSDDIDEIWGLGENEYPGLTKVLLSSKGSFTYYISTLRGEGGFVKCL